MAARSSNVALHRGLLKVALGLFAAAAAALALGFQMTDIGHFAGFALMALTLTLGAAYVLWNARGS